jgi:hypothetical protein
MKEPHAFTSAYAQLVCRKCNQVIEWTGYDWEHSERIAERIAHTHVCGMRPINVDEAREAMQLHRANNPGLSFEEECQVYNEIIKNQTFLDEQ